MEGKLLKRRVPPLPPDLARPEVSREAEREFWMSLLRFPLRLFRRKKS